MGQDTRENGMRAPIKEMERATKSGLMDLSMKDTGRMTKLMVEVV